jgi:hypothetical protein
MLFAFSENDDLLYVNEVGIAHNTNFLPMSMIINCDLCQ